jgi:hypothetical protein
MRTCVPGFALPIVAGCTVALCGSLNAYDDAESLLPQDLRGIYQAASQSRMPPTRR